MASVSMSVALRLISSRLRTSLTYHQAHRLVRQLYLTQSQSRSQSQPPIRRLHSARRIATATPTATAAAMSAPAAPVHGVHCVHKAPAPRKEHRLPTDVVPRHYSVELRPDLQAATFAGTLAVSIDVTSATRTVELNAVELQVQSANIVCGSRTLTASSISLNEADEILTLSFDEELAVGSATLHLAFTGILNDQMRGFYLSKYNDADGHEQRLATTQFEATDCRRAMPCWDEPAVKATFSVSLVCPSSLRALSNMPCTSSTAVGDDGALSRHVFAPTPPMSTYLLAFVIGAFDMIEAHTSEGTLVRCFATPGKGEQNRFALDFAVKLLPFYNKWFECHYPLPKLDMVAIPDFAAGAMENWGLITYREAALLLDPAHSSAQTKQWVAVCVAHEIAHQWFGNLVTMEWWTHLWLNEGFATWMENYAVDHFFPEFKMWEQFVYSDLNSAFELDALASSHPIEVPVGHASEVDEIFDTISYAKGCCVIRMLEVFLGAEDFRRGLCTYMKQFEYGNALTDDLWAVLSRVSGKDVEKMMTAWTKETGFPLIELEEVENAAQPDTLQFQAKQSRFMQEGPDSNSAALWPVPIDFLLGGQSGSNAVSKQILADRSGVLSVDLKAAGVQGGKPKWVKLNAGQVGMFRVRYPPRMFAALCEAVKSRDPLLSAADRLGVQNDAFALTRCGLLTTVQLLQLVQSFENEEEYTVWADLIGNLGDISLLLQSQPEVFANFSSYVNRLTAKIMARVGWEKSEGEGHTLSLLRAKIIGVTAKYGAQSTIDTGLAKFTAYLASGQATAGAKEEEGEEQKEEKKAGAASAPAPTLSPDLRSAVYGIAVKHGAQFGYATMLHLLEKSSMSEEQVRCLQSLASATDPALLRRTLDMALSPKVRTQDGPSLIAAVAANRVGAPLYWEFCKNNWDGILKKFGQSSSLSRIASQCGNFSSRQLLAEVRSFFDSHAHPGAERAVKQAIERLESNVKWIERDGKEAAEWLANNEQQYQQQQQQA